MLAGALDGWQDSPSVGDLRRRLQRLLIELSEPKTIQEAVDKAFKKFPPEGK
jgi:hypothetical protein